MPKAKIYYHDIGDYLSREEKLNLVKKLRSFGNNNFPFVALQPNEHGDWLSERNEVFSQFIPLNAEKKGFV